MAARRGKSQARRNSGNGTPGWVWLVAGAAIAAAVFLAAPGLFKKDGDFLRAGPRPNPDAQPAPVADAEVDAPAELPRPAATAKAPDAPAQAPTQYDFYTLLPGKEVAMSDAELAASARAEEARKARALLENRDPRSVAMATQAATAGTTTPAAANPVPLAEAPTAGTPAGPAPRPVVAEPPAGTATASASPSSAPAAAALPAATDGTRYILQAGSFGGSGDAETTKAKIAMLGLAARVESAEIGGKTVYRVRMGPYGSATELSEAKQKLANSGLPAMAIKAQ
ncbi:SPOR domain-containing protein [Stenotrophomonas sp. MMGLT7]|uniref:SPOR domain-containing protein n=1 Tax=Stenotrophomonas sp. MMGLT7 TaxID=2901227 RepID=UPI001E4966BC|nr:SPOR domain-containing protein [Stenotrophomonas sp. MMGLT7]MCD7098414.1 SPOR domain-containing protein [Stenotrophomonas sp. MMGLT7]